MKKYMPMLIIIGIVFLIIIGFITYYFIRRKASSPQPPIDPDKPKPSDPDKPSEPKPSEPKPSDPKGIGSACTLHTDCEGWGPGATAIACCNNKCTQKMKDWAGIGYCPADCVGSPTGKPGTCGIYSWPREKGEPCKSHTDCKGWGPGATQMACCKGKCTQKKKDWAGTGYCPFECVGGIGKKPGTC